MKSELVVISWWSNCLGLACLHNLVRYTGNRTIYVIQTGKPEEQKERFRVYLPSAVKELPYLTDQPADDWRVRETVARDLLGTSDGLWFIDHDLFVREDCQGWLDDMDQRFDRSNVCLCHPLPVRGPSITAPAFWLSPKRFPPGMPGFTRLPYYEDPVASKPYAPHQTAPLMMPEKDTLVVAKEFLHECGMVDGFPLTDQDRITSGPLPFPRHEHIGGLYTFTGEVPSELHHDWVVGCVDRFTEFYSACPPAWISIEDLVLLQRLEKFRHAFSKST